MYRNSTLKQLVRSVANKSTSVRRLGKNTNNLFGSLRVACTHSMTPSAVSSSSCFKTFSTSMRTLADETVEAQHVSERSDVIIEADENFRAFIDSGEPIIVDFYAEYVLLAEFVNHNIYRFY